MMWLIAGIVLAVVCLAESVHHHTTTAQAFRDHREGRGIDR